LFNDTIFNIVNINCEYASFLISGKNLPELSSVPDAESTSLQTIYYKITRSLQAFMLLNLQLSARNLNAEEEDISRYLKNGTEEDILK